MPLYEYRCPDCDARYEVLQRFSDPPKTTCEECESTRLEKLISAPAFQFKGSGWYVTDYARKGNGKTDGDGKTDTKSNDGDKTEAKSSDGDKKSSDGGKKSSDGGKSETTSKDAKSSSESKSSKTSSSSDAAT